MFWNDNVLGFSHLNHCLVLLDSISVSLSNRGTRRTACLLFWKQWVEETAQRTGQGGVWGQKTAAMILAASSYGMPILGCCHVGLYLYQRTIWKFLLGTLLIPII